MYDKLGPLGLVGLLVIVGGIALIAYENILIAAGLAMILVGLGFVVKGLLTSMLSSFGMF